MKLFKPIEFENHLIKYKRTWFGKESIIIKKDIWPSLEDLKTSLNLKEIIFEKQFPVIEGNK